MVKEILDLEQPNNLVSQPLDVRHLYSIMVGPAT